MKTKMRNVIPKFYSLIGIMLCLMFSEGSLAAAIANCSVDFCSEFSYQIIILPGWCQHESETKTCSDSECTHEVERRTCSDWMAMSADQKVGDPVAEDFSGESVGDCSATNCTRLLYQRNVLALMCRGEGNSYVPCASWCGSYGAGRCGVYPGHPPKGQTFQINYCNKNNKS